jgi:hypothetical protein
MRLHVTRDGHTTAERKLMATMALDTRGGSVQRRREVWGPLPLLRRSGSLAVTADLDRRPVETLVQAPAATRSLPRPPPSVHASGSGSGTHR